MAQTSAGGKRQAEAGTVKEAEAVCDELRAALGAAGVVLPSLWVECAAYVDDKPLITLGRCNLETARKLVAALAGPHTPSA
jgi:hypothetical protein